ncbi:MAG TPA: hypothetical protein LFW21_00545 [Rickettsia endosymbiont of Pyrocoelia pectoralis]|nr:hypothetical protein [Rickettsia endosymbiont of Pyrocoelia pectoralis]
MATEKEKEQQIEQDSRLKKAIDNIKSKLNTIDPTQLAVLLIAVNTLIAEAGDSPLKDSLLSLQEQIIKQEEKAQGVTNAKVAAEIEKAREAQSLQEQKESEAKENALRETRLTINSTAYAKISTKFPEQLKSRNDLLENYDNLSEEEKRRFTRQGLTDAARKDLEKEDKEISERYKLAYQVKEDAEKVKKYKEERIKENNEKLKGADFNTKEAIEKENVEHSTVIAECKKHIESIKPVESERDRELALLEKRVKTHPEAAIHGIKEHYKTNKEEYQKLKQQDPHHSALEKLENLVIACGGHEKLGLTKNSQETSKSENLSPKAKEIPAQDNDSKKISSTGSKVKSWIASFTNEANNQNTHKTKEKSSTKSPVENKNTESAVSKFSKRKKEIDGITR